MIDYVHKLMLMKKLFIFLSSIIIGFLLVFIYKTFSPTKQVETLQKQTEQASHFSIENPPSNSLKGEIATFSGEVQWQSRTATEGAKLDAVRPLQQGENIITKKGTALLQFPNIGTIDV